MKTLRILAFGFALALALLGFGGCRYLWALGEAAGKPQRVIVEVPGLMKKQ